jgi:hypothetical protein
MKNLHHLPPVTRAKALALSPCPIELGKFLQNAGFAGVTEDALRGELSTESACDQCNRSGVCQELSSSEA